MMVTAPLRTHKSYCPTIANVYAYKSNSGSRSVQETTHIIFIKTDSPFVFSISENVAFGGRKVR